MAHQAEQQLFEMLEVDHSLEEPAEDGNATKKINLASLKLSDISKPSDVKNMAEWSDLKMLGGKFVGKRFFEVDDSYFRQVLNRRTNDSNLNSFRNFKMMQYYLGKVIKELPAASPRAQPASKEGSSSDWSVVESKSVIQYNESRYQELQKQKNLIEEEMAAMLLALRKEASAGGYVEGGSPRRWL